MLYFWQPTREAQGDRQLQMSSMSNRCCCSSSACCSGAYPPPPLGYNEYVGTVTWSDPKKQNAFCRARMLQPSPVEDEYTYKSGVISPWLSCHLFWLTPTPETWRETRGFRFLEKIFKFPLDSLVLPFVVLPFDSCSFFSGAFTSPSWLIDQLSDKSIGQLETNCSWLEKS